MAQTAAAPFGERLFLYLGCERKELVRHPSRPFGLPAFLKRLANSLDCATDTGFWIFHVLLRSGSILNFCHKAAEV